MTLATTAGFWAVSILFVITPGADWAYAISAGLRHRSVVPAVGGLLAGHLLATVAVAAGVAALVARSPSVLTALTVAGAAYLVWLGVGQLTGPAGVNTTATSSREVSSWMQQAAVGLGVSGLNPKVFLLFLALLPQFVDADTGWPVPAQIVALGMVHVLSCAVVYTLVGSSARSVLRGRPATAAAVTRFSGVAMVVIGTALILEPSFH